MPSKADRMRENPTLQRYAATQSSGESGAEDALVSMGAFVGRDIALYARRVEQPDEPAHGEPLAPLDDRLQIGPYILTPRGLEFAAEPTRHDIETFGKHLGGLNKSLAWIVADWVAGAAKVYGETYDRFAEWTGKSAHTLRQWRWLASSVELSVRTDNSTLFHAQKVAALPQDWQRYWLNEASKRKWSAQVLERMIAKHPSGLPEDYHEAPKVPRRNTPMLRFNRAFETAHYRIAKIAQAASVEDRAKMAQMLREMADQLENQDGSADRAGG